MLCVLCMFDVLYMLCRVVRALIAVKTFLFLSERKTPDGSMNRKQKAYFAKTTL